MPQVDNADFDAIFDAAVAEVEGGGGDSADSLGQKPNAKVHMGDGESFDPQAGDDEADVDLFEDDDDTDTDESFDDETSDESDTDDDGETSDKVLDLSTEGDKLVTVKVAGKDVTIPLQEALNGYMRQSDYTQKTQALSEIRKVAEWGAELQDALRTDPQGVVRYLANAYEVNLAEGDDALQSDDPEIQGVLNELKSTKAQLAEMQRTTQRQAEQAVLADVKAEVARMNSTYEDFDPYEVLPYATERGLNMEEAYLLLRAKSGKQPSLKGKADDTVQKEAEKAARIEAKKRQARKVAQGGGRRANGGAPEPKFDTFEDMLTHELSKAR